jgi:hypothetical protein
MTLPLPLPPTQAVAEKAGTERVALEPTRTRVRQRTAAEAAPEVPLPLPPEPLQLMAADAPGVAAFSRQQAMAAVVVPPVPLAQADQPHPPDRR